MEAVLRVQYVQTLTPTSYGIRIPSAFNVAVPIRPFTVRALSIRNAISAPRVALPIKPSIAP